MSKERKKNLIIFVISLFVFIFITPLGFEMIQTDIKSPSDYWGYVVVMFGFIIMVVPFFGGLILMGASALAFVCDLEIGDL